MTFSKSPHKVFCQGKEGRTVALFQVGSYSGPFLLQVNIYLKPHELTCSEYKVFTYMKDLIEIILD